MDPPTSVEMKISLWWFMFVSAALLQWAESVQRISSDMASLNSFIAAASSSSSCQNHSLCHPLKSPLPLLRSFTLPRNTKKKSSASVWPLFCALNNQPLQYRKLGDSDLNISEITLGTVSHIFSYIKEKRNDIVIPSFVFILVGTTLLISDDLWGAEHGERSSRHS